MSLSVIIITKNEAAVIARCLQSVAWADEIILFDTDSSDGTPEIARKLGAKEYWTQYKPSPEFVILFLPNEALFSTALQLDPKLIENAWGEKVIIATPVTLLSVLRTIAHSWDRVEVEQENAISLCQRHLSHRLQLRIEEIHKATADHVGRTLHGRLV
mgnify:CR=1 FL=1